MLFLAHRVICTIGDFLANLKNLNFVTQKPPECRHGLVVIRSFQQGLFLGQIKLQQFGQSVNGHHKAYARCDHKREFVFNIGVAES